VRIDEIWLEADWNDRIEVLKAGDRKEMTNLNDSEREMGTVRSMPHTFVDYRVLQAPRSPKNGQVRLAGGRLRRGQNEVAQLIEIRRRADGKSSFKRSSSSSKTS
jgi:hypothetical protein